MIKVYDTNKQFLDFIESYKKLRVEDRLDTGLRTLRFQVPCLARNFELFEEENYLNYQGAEFVIKEINSEKNDFFTVYADANIEDLVGSMYSAFDVHDKTIRSAYDYCLQNTPWKLDYQSTNKSIVEYQVANTDAYTMIKVIAADYKHKLFFDTTDFTLHVYDKRGTTAGTYFSNELKLVSLKKQSSTYNYATVLFPIGKDGLTIGTINNGKNYIENFSYSNKYIAKIWINEDYDVAEKLKAAAESYLQSIAVPRASYKLKLSSLDREVEVGDEIILVDKIKRIKQKQRVVRLVRCPQSPEESVVEISNLQENFAFDFINEQKNVRKELEYVKATLKNLTSS